MNRRTIAHPVSLDGIGLHLGEPCCLQFHPAPSGSGITFRRMDLEGSPSIPALAEHALLTERHTQLGHDPVSVHTVEHVLAAVAGCGYDDVEIRLDGPEPPIMDGSAAQFVDALTSAGVAEQQGEVKYLMLRRALQFSDGESHYEVTPARDLELDVTIDFPHPIIGVQRCSYKNSRDAFANEIGPARTFGFMREVDALRAMGLIQGASLENAIVLDDTGVLGTPLRWPDEFVRHKALDCLGDRALAGMRVRAHVRAVKPSHRATVQLVRAMKDAAREKTVIEIDDIMKVLAHRYPFLLVDRILEIDEKRVVGLKNVTINEPFFQGHFPGHPIMPGVLIIEAMAQVGGMLLMGSVPDPESKVVYFTSLNNVKWRRPVKPGDKLRFELELLQVRGMMCKMSGVAKVDGQVVCEAEMGAVVREK